MMLRSAIIITHIPEEQVACHGNFGPPKILVPGPKFSVKLVRADNVFLKKLVLIQKSWSAVLVQSSRARCIYLAPAPRSPVLRRWPTALFIVAFLYV